MPIICVLAPSIVWYVMLMFITMFRRFLCLLASWWVWSIRGTTGKLEWGGERKDFDSLPMQCQLGSVAAIPSPQLLGISLVKLPRGTSCNKSDSQWGPSSMLLGAWSSTLFFVPPDLEVIAAPLSCLGCFCVFPFFLFSFFASHNPNSCVADLNPLCWNIWHGFFFPDKTLNNSTWYHKWDSQSGYSRTDLLMSLAANTVLSKLPMQNGILVIHVLRWHQDK